MFTGTLFVEHFVLLRLYQTDLHVTVAPLSVRGGEAHDIDIGLRYRILWHNFPFGIRLDNDDYDVTIELNNDDVHKDNSLDNQSEDTLNFHWYRLLQHLHTVNYCVFYVW